jgi:hypothetical protein
VSAGVPSHEALEQALREAIAAGGSSSEVSLVDREHDLHAATSPNETVVVTFDDARVRIFCKYAGGRDHNMFGHRGGVPYESKVYTELLSKIEVGTPRCFGVHVDPASSDTWLFLEYIERSEWFAMDPTVERFSAATRWLGSFHSQAAHLVGDPELEFLNRYDVAYYVGWANRTLEYARPLGGKYPWLRSVCEAFEDVAKVLTAGPQTVVHGEFYKKNVLMVDGLIRPVDWESAAIAPGEIDLVTVGDGWWAPGVVPAGEAAYIEARGLDGGDPAFKTRYEAARLYLQLRWLGDRPEWTSDPNLDWRFESALAAAVELGLV